MQVDLSTNFFDLFGVEPTFIVNTNAISQRFLELQKQLHPDKFAAKPDVERRWSLQAASFVNEGYQTLSNDLRRAIYLLKLHGVSTDEETDTQMSPMFLMEQMECREALESVPSAKNPTDALQAVRQTLKSGVTEQKAAFTQACEKQDWAAGRIVVREWQFLNKLSQEVKSTEERLDV